MLDFVLLFVLIIVVVGLISEVNELSRKLSRPKRMYRKNPDCKRWKSL